MPKKGLKVGKDVLNKKSSAILTAKEREDFEKWKAQKLAEDLAKEEKDEQKEQELAKKKIVSKLPEEKEPSPDQLAKQKAEVTAGIRRLKVKKVVLKEEEE